MKLSSPDVCLPRPAGGPTVQWTAAVMVALFGVLSPAAASRAQEATPQRPERVGSDAPHQERNPTKRPEAYLLHPAAPVVVETAPAPSAKPANAATLPVAGPKKKTRAARNSRGTNPTAKTVPVRKAIPVGPSPEEIAAEREAYRAEMRRPTPVGNDAPHYERSGNPDVSAGRIFTIERP